MWKMCRGRSRKLLNTLLRFIWTWHPRAETLEPRAALALSSGACWSRKWMLWVVSVARALLSARRQCECSSAVDGIARAARAHRSRFCRLLRVKRSATAGLITHSRIAPLFQATRTWISPGFPFSNMDARSEGCSFAQWDGHAEHRWWSVLFCLSDHAVITPLTR